MWGGLGFRVKGFAVQGAASSLTVVGVSLRFMKVTVPSVSLPVEDYGFGFRAWKLRI